MTVSYMPNHGRFGGFSAKLFPTLRTREALADYAARMAPTGRRKWVERRFNLTSELARTVCEGSASAATVDHCFRVGGWDLVLEVFAELLGERVDQHLERERRAHEERAAKLGESVRRLRSVGG